MFVIIPRGLPGLRSLRGVSLLADDSAQATDFHRGDDARRDVEGGHAAPDDEAVVKVPFDDLHQPGLAAPVRLQKKLDAEYDEQNDGENSWNLEKACEHKLVF